MSIFAEVQEAPPIEVFQLTRECAADEFPNKVNLGVGAYRTDEGKPWVLPIVRKVEGLMAADETLNKEYLPVLGLDAASSAATKMLLGSSSKAISEGRAFGVQSISGTGALRVGAEFLAKQLNRTVFYMSTPTWGNHKLIFLNAGFKECHQYRYWDPKTRGVNITGFLEDLRAAPEGSVIILHACAHNPTGCDPTMDQWKEIAAVMKEKKLFPFFDSAYQGFASGDLDQDAQAVRFFVEQGFEVFCAQSFAKNFGLYNERIGNLAIVMSDSSLAAAVKSQITLIVRGMYSNPPNHGARIVAKVLNDPELFKEWQECIRTMSSRIKEMRASLLAKLTQLGTPGDWNHITQQIGMFSFKNVSVPWDQVAYMKSNYHIYLMSSGRINICGLTTKNVDYVAQAIDDAVRKFPATSS
ncbi:unnamed protein product [Cyprideis torosa]|uniref:Aspartate aminotransferase n=1 Tax=Cyprideis torosa TaxID=163714 RepID=A0A7R8WBU5_9CRUS|nr:unnamed protein product [Cyprideis torosa]CAG0892485.1 unnamed protein product [Cyprideis torosa]